MKLTQSLKCLSTKEYAAFESFLQNDLVNKRTDLLGLFKVLKADQFMLQDKIAIYKKVYPDSLQFESTKWRLLCSRLLKVLEQYFAFSHFNSQKNKQQIELGEFYWKQKRQRKFSDTLKNAQKLFAKTENQTEQFWLKKYIWNEMNYDFIESQNRRKKTSLKELSDNLDAFYFIAKIKIALRALSRAMINAEEYAIQMLEEVISNIEGNETWLNIPALKVYYQCYKAIREEGTERDFEILRKSIHQHKEVFTSTELRDVYLVAINYCIRKLNSSEAKYNREALELYRLSLRAGILHENGYLTAPTYNNIVTLSIKESEFEWATKFIADYKDSLRMPMRNSLHQFCSAKILFSQDNYDDCQIILAMIPNNVPFIYLGAKMMQIKIFIDKNEIEALESLLESLRVYLQRRKDLGYRKDNYVHLIKFSKRLLQLPAMDKKTKEAFRNEIKNAEIFTEKKWFLNRIK